MDTIVDNAIPNLQALIDDAKSRTLDNSILRIEATAKGPFVYLNSESGILLMKGKGILEDTIKFFKPIVEFIEFELCNQIDCPRIIHAHLAFEYYNTDVSKCILGILKKLESLYQRGVYVELYWYYPEDDEDTLEAGEDFENQVSFPFNFIENIE